MTCRCEEGVLPDEATSSSLEIASGKEQERPRNDIGNGETYVSPYR
jgi:hypothetical protein